MQRLVDLILETSDDTAAYKPISNLARLELQSISRIAIEKRLKSCGDKMDAYSKAHLMEVTERIERALDASYTYNSAQASPSSMMMLFGRENFPPQGDDE